MGRPENFYKRDHFKYYPTDRLVDLFNGNCDLLVMIMHGTWATWMSAKEIEDHIHHKVAVVKSIHRILLKRFGSQEVFDSAVIAALLKE